MNPSARYNACVHGSGKRTVVLAHGFGTTQKAWGPHVQSLVDAGFRAVVFDFAGSTDATAPFYDPERHSTLFGFTEDVLELMDELGVRGATFVGHSVSGIVGLLAANAEPERFDSLVLIGSSARYLDDPETGYQGGQTLEQVDALAKSMYADYASWANGFAPIAVGNADRPHLALEFGRCLLSLQPNIAAAFLPAILRIDHRRDALSCRLPNLVLQTAADPVVPLAAAQWLARATRASALEIVGTEGHFPHLSAPELVLDHLTRFLSTLAR